MAASLLPLHGQRQGHAPAFSSDPSASLTATGIPEVVGLIARHLSKTEVAACALVSRAWHLAYTPFLWKTITARIPNPHNALILPDLLSRFGSLIRTLVVTDLHEHFLSRSEPTSELVFDCPGIDNVVRLTVRTDRDKKRAFQSIIHRNRLTLRFLWLTFQVDKSKKSADWRGEPIMMLKPPRPDQELQSWLAQTRMPYLQSLYLEQWKMSREELIWILRACPALTLLSLKDTHIVHEDVPLSTASGSLEDLDMTSLSIDAIPIDADTESGSSSGGDEAAETDIQSEPPFQHHALQTFRMCSRLSLLLDLFPNIKTIEFYQFDRPANELELELFCESIRSHCLNLTQIWSYGYECSMLPLVLNSLKNGKGLVEFRGCSDMPTVLSILEHARTLEEANLTDFTEETYLPLKFLETCPRLTRFYTGQSPTTMTDVKESVIDHGWACMSSLKELRLGIKKISPALIEAIMQDLGAEREVDPKMYVLKVVEDAKEATSSNKAPPNKASSNKATPWLVLQQRHRQRILEEIAALTPEQQDFRILFADYLRKLPCLERVNIGSGYYKIPSRSRRMSTGM
ncbi:hypothetical protein BGZ98_000746 [Dissophora globulifera]|nr:hypothetical protein BGZ98_000746 [Dissophora globulifera]